MISFHVQYRRKENIDNKYKIALFNTVNPRWKKPEMLIKKYWNSFACALLPLFIMLFNDSWFVTK